MTTIIGVTLIALPAVLVFGWMCHNLWELNGGRVLAWYLAACAAIAASVISGVYLLGVL